MVLVHKGAREKFIAAVKDGCGDAVSINTTATVIGGVVANMTRRLLVATVSSDYTDTDADWASGKVVLDFGTTQTDGAEQMTDAAMIMIGINEGSGQVIYETPRSSVQIVPNPLG